jgi:acetoacetate decarboxylase
VTRLGLRLISVQGRISGSAPVPADQVNTEFYFKFLRAPDGHGLTDPHLVYGRYHRHYEVLESIDASVELGDSPLDPVSDILVQELRSVTWCRRRTVQTGEIAERVPEEWILPFVHQRYDDMALLAALPLPAGV